MKDKRVFTPGYLRLMGVLCSIIAILTLLTAATEVVRRLYLDADPSLNLAEELAKSGFAAYLTVLHFLFARERSHE